MHGPNDFLHHTFSLKMHIAAISISYIAFGVAFVAAVLYLVQDNAIKNKRTGIFFSRLPDLSFLDKLIYRSIGLGFPVLALAILSGVIWTVNIHGVYLWGYNSRQFYSIVLWLFYAVILHVRLSAKMRGRKVALMCIFAFFIIILSLLGTCP